MILRSIALSNFRKFREPLRIEGFTDGLNIVIEPNETGKSTILEALRAAFFVRYSAKTELVRSYVPLGDDVAPRVAIAFDVKGQGWTLEKQFLKSAFVRLEGGGGRRESDAAEETLQQLLGFERGNSRGTDEETRGPLGMLWVEQMGALEVKGPNRIVRDSIRGVLEAEVGAVTGGRRFDAIRAGVETAYSALRTPATGKSRGDLLAAEARASAAAAARQAAETGFRDYEHALAELDGVKARLRLLERDLVDPETVETRKALEADQKVAESAVLRATAAEAQFGRAEEVARTASSRIERLAAAETRAVAASALLQEKSVAEAAARAASDGAGDEEKRLRACLDDARSMREARETALGQARERARAHAVAAAARRAVDARRALADLEARERLLVEEAAGAIPERDLGDLAKLERAAIEARARFEAGAVRVEVAVGDGVPLRIDGVESDVAWLDILAATKIELGDAGSVTIRPPRGAGRSIEADLATASEALAAALRSLGLDSHSAGVARNERAAAAARELTALRSQMAAACPGDATIALAPGADALRAFVAELGAGMADALPPADDLDALEAGLGEARLAEADAAGRHDDSRIALSKAETVLARTQAELGSALREDVAAREDLRNVLEGGDRGALEGALAEARRERAQKLEALEDAREGSRAFDVDAIRRRIENLDRAARRAGEERLELTARIASLESTIAREGTTGPAGVLAEAREEEDAAIAAVDKLRREADVLEMLRSVLLDAANEASRTFMGPVTRRAGHYVERLLPGSGLSFDEALGLSGVARAGMEEACADLSRGTQEQLAILTRLAFADLLLEDGAPVSLILDDPLVYSDDTRLETMTDILKDASSRMQVILLTCRSKAFRHVDANRMMLK
ncbi:AAA family ATPase [Sphingomonas colocasiae]|uniref:AAA family ATPase n=1 Tax=Sphingomonas colocasiae TaxID=1848973 RepID=A0ABS7PSK0_9SPHN|nr:AAA family ATPase [Sphingomonas colocasiae]MBY8823367.1 AAA family ATPase [Sphingomonas colocasiae]